MLGIVAGVYRVEVEGEVLECTLRGRLRRGEEGRVAVGDRVRVERLPAGGGRVAERLPRRSALARRGPGGRELKVIAANVDQVAAVLAAARPDPDLTVLDRLLVLGELNSLACLVVVNKLDLVPGGRLPALFDPYRKVGYTVLGTSIRTGAGVEELGRRLAGRVSAFTGPSGVGKSSLANRLIPQAGLRVGEVGARGGRGRHTTANPALIPLPGGGYLADTPGFQYVGVGEVPAAELAGAFPELRPLAGRCRFTDCRHWQEPECAVQAAVETGEVSPRRYESYRTLLEESASG